MLCSLLLATITHWSVPAMSTEQRLPDRDPSDGEKGGRVRIVMAQEEYEPGSFVLLSDADLGKVELKPGVFRNERGATFPAENLDLKVIKVWYQSKNGWFSYFADNGNKLCPELLLNDEDLIRVDVKTQSNYARLRETDARGRVTAESEQWLNPPTAVDPGFLCMKPNFRDAKTFQPVALGKGVRKQFFLTAKTTKDTPPGVYRGVVEVRSKVEKGKSAEVLHSVPVDIRVMDFVLPPPKAYVHPEMDFLVSFYNYSSIGRIMEWNGHDAELAWKQLEATLVDCVKHGQTMHWVPAGPNPESDRTLDIMNRIGMRTDVVMGGASARQWGLGEKFHVPSNVTACAAFAAKYYDRKLGHHNLYIGHGDEPGCGWFKDERWVFDIWQKAGFKFVIAAQDGIFWKVGYDWNWHNASKDPCETTCSPDLFNQLGSHTHTAWYANQHVGPEDPDFNRRQYGLGAYLGGYSADCNYAHHYGPYNDQGDYYKPMVFAYGSGDGVLDTIQWEGFREGIDDIRYATELKRCAMLAEKSSDFELSRLGRRALMYMASIKRQSDSLDTIRVEMAGYILKLRAALGKDAPAPLFQAKNEKYVEGRVMDYWPPEKPRWSGWTTEGVEAEIAKFLEKAEKPGRNDDPAKLRARAAEKLVFLCTYTHCIKPVTLGRWKEAEPYYRRLLPLIKDNTNFVWKCDDALAFAKFRAAVGDAKGADALYAAAAADPRVKPEQAFSAKAIGALYGFKGDEKAALAVLEREYAPFKGKLDKKAFDGALKGVAKHLGGDGRESVIRALLAFRNARYALHAPRKTAVVKFSKKTISGLEGFAAAAALSDPQKMDRLFGGETDMLDTDVSTGDRAKAGKGGLDPAKTPKLDVICDLWGLHVRMTIPSDEARRIEAGLAGGPSLEGYVAPGENTPYICMTSNLRPGTMGFFNTSYDSATHRRARKTDTANYRQDVGFTDDAVILYYGLSWDLFPTHLPKNGDVWEFEQVLWGATSYTWNGVESIHGRETWGALKFQLGDADRAALVKKRLLAGKVKLIGIHRWSGEMYSGEMKEGVLDHWSDGVIGDSAFYAEKVEPYITGVKKLCEEVSPEMTDAKVLELDRKLLPDLEGYRFIIDRMRGEYLRKQLAN